MKENLIKALEDDINAKVLSGQGKDFSQSPLMGTA